MVTNYDVELLLRSQSVDGEPGIDVDALKDGLILLTGDEELSLVITSVSYCHFNYYYSFKMRSREENASFIIGIYVYEPTTIYTCTGLED